MRRFDFGHKLGNNEDSNPNFIDDYTPNISL